MKIRLNESNWAVPVEATHTLDHLYGGLVAIEVWRWDPETGHRRIVSGLTSPLAAMYECWALARHSRQHHPDDVEFSGMAAALLPLPGSDAGLIGAFYFTIRFPDGDTDEDFIEVAD